MWQQTIAAKITNQANLLKQERIENKYMLNLSQCVKSGDSDNCEARAAVYYWKNIFPEFLQFRRERYGPPPNNLLNYGYAILRAIVARSLVSSGLLPTLGIHHRNQYNAYCLGR
ncbi:MAG: type II CRISPR-associated endonuclease Cas1 [Chitinophagaceae bacterium]